MRGFRGKEVKAVADYAAAMQSSAGDGVVMADTGIGRAVHLAQSELKELGRPWTGFIAFDADGRYQYYIRCGVVVGPDGMFIRPALRYERVPNDEGGFETIELPREYDASGLEIRAVYADEGHDTLYIVLKEDLSGYDITNDVDYDETPPEFVMAIADVDTNNREIIPRHSGVVVWRPITDSDGSYGDAPKTRSRSLDVTGDDWFGLRKVGLAGFGGDFDYAFPWQTAYEDSESGQRAKTECDNTGVVACVKGEPTKLRYYRAWPLYVHGDADSPNMYQESIERYILEHEDGRTWRVLSLYGWWYLGAELPPSDKDIVSEEWSVAVWQGGNVAWLNLVSLLGRWEGIWNNGALDDTYQPQYFESEGAWSGECLAVPSSNSNEQAWVPLDDYIQTDPFYSGISDAADELQTQIAALELVWRETQDRMTAVYNRLLAAEARYAAIVQRVNGLKERVARLKLL